MPSVQLAPLTLGELLDRTFSTFRRHFWLFAGIMVFPEALLVGLNVILQVLMRSLAVPHGTPAAPPVPAQSAAFAAGAGIGFLAIMIPYYVAYALAHGATTYALSEVYLGRGATIRESYRVVWRRFGRLLSVVFSVLIRTYGVFVLAVLVVVLMATSLVEFSQSTAWTILLGLLLLVGFFAVLAVGVLVFIYLLRYGVAVPALLLEKLSPRQALKRSVLLTKGYLWRLLVVFILMVMIRMIIVLVCQSPFSIATFSTAVRGVQPNLWLTIASLLVGGVAAAATAPLLMIGFAIAYYDLRVRKEGFDLQLMMENLDGAGAASAPQPVPTAEEAQVEDASIAGMLLLTFLTAGIYVPIWFLRRRKALNRLNSPEKLGLPALVVALAGYLASFLLPLVGSFKWGSWVEAENALGPLPPLITLVVGIIIVVHCFKVRRILVDHLTPQQDGMFSASIRLQYDDLLSRAGTFFLGIFYLQHKINGLWEKLRPEPARDQVSESPAILAPPPSPMSAPE
jgi:hypothetical protein